MPELKTVLGFEAADAIMTLKTMNAELNSWTASMKNAAATASVFNRNSGKVESTFKRTGAAAQEANVKTKGYYAGVTKGSRSAASAVEAGAKRQEDAGKRVLLSWQSVVRIFAIQVIHQAVTQITTAMWEGVSAARDYEISLAEIQTIGKGFRADFEGLADQVRDFSDAVGAPIEGVAEGVYQTLSNQVTDTAHAFEFMAASQAFAIASVTETSASVALLSSVMNSYNEEIDQATKVGGKLAKIIELGRLRGEEFANTFGRITVLAAQLGITLDETGATLATLTVSGLRYNEASTLMLNIMLKLIRPTDALKDRFHELGISSAEAGIQAFGFQGFLDKISEKAGTSATELGKLFNRVRAIRGVMGLANENAEKYQENLEGIRAAGADELFEKRDIIFETNAKQVQIQLNQLRNTMVDGFGRGVNEILGTLFDTFGGAVNTMKALGAATIAGSVAFAALKFQALAASGALAAAGAAFGPFLIVAGVATAVAAILALRGQAEAAREAIEAQSRLALDTRIKNMDIEIEEEKRKNAELLGNLQKHIFAQQRLFDVTSKNVAKLEDLIFEGITTQLGQKIGEVSSYFDNLQQQSRAAQETIKTLNSTIQLVQFDLSDFNFERSVRGVEPVRKAFAEIERSSDLRRKALAAARKGEADLADVYNQRAKATATAALNTAEESGNRTLISKAVKEVQASYRNEIALLETKKKLTIASKNQIDAESISRQNQLEQLKLLNNEVELLVEEFAEVKLDPIKREQILNQAFGLARDMETIFSAVEIKFDFNTSLTEIRNSVTGEVSKITSSVAKAFGILDDQLAGLTKPKTEVIAVLQDIFKDAKTPEALSNAVTEYGKVSDTVLDTTKSRAIAEREISAALEKNRTLLSDLAKAYSGIDPSSILSIFKGGLSRFFDPEGTKQASEASTEAIDLVTEAVKILGKQDFDAKAFTKIQESLADLGKEQPQEIVQGLTAIITNLNAIADNKVKIRQQTLFSQEELDTTAFKLGVLSTKLGTETAAAATQGAAGVATAQASIRAELTKTTQAAIATAAVLAAAGGGGAVGKRFGSLLYRADGGFTPRGTDNIPAMLSPGEYVMDAANTRRFYSQLVAMSSGKQPIYRASGGPVTNIGDVSINVTETVSAQQTARETMQAFRRQTRRRASTL